MAWPLYTSTFDEKNFPYIMIIIKMHRSSKDQRGYGVNPIEANM